jgi:hypothetical protein
MAFARAHHAEGTRDFQRGIFHDGERHAHAQIIMNGAQPGQMGKQAVHRMAQQFAVQRGKTVCRGGQFQKFAGAHRGEIGRVRKNTSQRPR